MPDQGFEDVVLDTNDVWVLGMVEVLGAPLLDAGELHERLNRCSESLAVPERAALVAGLVRSNLMPNPPPDLLVDQVERKIKADDTPFLPPLGGSAFELPEWVRARVLHRDLVEALRQELRESTSLGLLGPLSVFGLQRYSTRELARHINVTTERKVREDPNLEENYRLAGLSVLFKVYRQGSASDERDETRMRPNFRVLVPNSEGRFARADTLYFGEQYPGGYLTEFLYRHVFPDKMVAVPEKLGLGGDSSRIGEFLPWLGVTSEPRIDSLLGQLSL